MHNKGIFVHLEAMLPDVLDAGSAVRRRVTNKERKKFTKFDVCGQFLLFSFALFVSLFNFYMWLTAPVGY